MMNKIIKNIKNGSMIIKHIVLLVVSLITLVPILWILISSFKSYDEIMTIPATLLPQNPTLASYIGMWTRAPFEQYTFNSILVSLAASILTLLICIFAAYGFARFRFRGAKIILTIFLLSQMFPGSSILIPVTQLILKFGLFNTRTGLSLVYTAFFIPFCTWLLYGYFKTIPKELEEAAFIDGCSRIRSLFRIILPISIPGIGAVFIFTFLGAWNEFLFAYVLTNSDNVRTISVGVANFIGQYITEWDKLSAAAVLFAIPPLILFFLLDKSLIKGLAAGSVKE